MIKIDQVAGYKCCITCVHRKPYPAATRDNQPVFYRFLCGLSVDTSRELVRPEDVCDFWNGAALNIE